MKDTNLYYNITMTKKNETSARAPYIHQAQVKTKCVFLLYQTNCFMTSQFMNLCYVHSITIITSSQQINIYHLHIAMNYSNMTAIYQLNQITYTS